MRRSKKYYNLKERWMMTTTNVQQLSDQVLILTREVQELKKGIRVDDDMR